MKKLLLIPLLFLSFAQAETIQCKVVGVHDGDSITCLTDKKEQIKVRLFQIDAPELGQPYGQKAKQVLSNMVFGKSLRINPIKKDRYKRTLGIIYGKPLNKCPFWANCKETIHEIINDEMVKQGYAWHYPFDTENLEYIQAEKEAREAKRGLWADKDPIAPWEWREKKSKH